MDIHWILTINNGLIIQFLYRNASMGSGWFTHTYPIALNKLIHVSSTILTAYNLTLSADVSWAAYETTTSIKYYCDGNVPTRHLLICGY